MKREIKLPVYEFRPDKLLKGSLLRYNNGLWSPDDGEYDIAFVSLNEQMVAYVELPYHDNILWSWCKNMNRTAYVAKHPNGNAWHYMSRNGERNWGDRWNRDAHINSVAGSEAMSYCAERKGCANGRQVEFHIEDKTIEAGLLRNSETKEVVVKPKIFDCIYCGEHDWREEENQLIK